MQYLLLKRQQDIPNQEGGRCHCKTDKPTLEILIFLVRTVSVLDNETVFSRVERYLMAAYFCEDEVVDHRVKRSLGRSGHGCTSR